MLYSNIEKLNLGTLSHDQYFSTLEIIFYKIILLSCVSFIYILIDACLTPTIYIYVDIICNTIYIRSGHAGIKLS